MSKKDQNVILIVVDALRAKSLGIYGKNPSPSPTMDKLARSGVFFNNAFTTALKTDPVTSSLMTGFYPVTNGLVNHESKITETEIRNISKKKMLAEILRENGYFTAAVDWLSRWYKRGFNYYSGWLVTQNKTDRKTFGEETFQRFMRIFDLLTLRIIKRDFLDRIYYSYTNPPYDPADEVVKDAIKVVEKNKKKNFFLYMHFWDPHYPYVRPRGLFHSALDSIEKRYLSEIEFVDSQIKKLIQSLKENNIEDRTLIIIIGDHGESLTEHGIYISHRGLYEETLKIPMIFYHPSLGRKKVESLVQIIDIAPTILDFLGIKNEQIDFDGRSLLPLITGKKEKIRNFAFAEDLTPGEFKIRKSVRRRVLRTEKYKYIQSFYGPAEFLFSVNPKIDKLDMKEELYDLKKDKTERKNIAERKNEIKLKLKKDLNLLIQKNIKKREVRNKVLMRDKKKDGLLEDKVKKADYNKDEVIKKFQQMGYW